MDFDGSYFIVTEKDGWEWTNERGQKSIALKGKILSICNKHIAKQLVTEGKIIPRSAFRKPNHDIKKTNPTISGGRSVTRRIGIWLKTSTHYSGGRIHMYQMAWTMAKLGCEVYLITNTMPKWIADYPSQERLHVLIESRGNIPADLDYVITDSKDELGTHAVTWVEAHPWARLICFNFETPNWVEKFVPEYAKKLTNNKDVFRKADILGANSKESMKYLIKWLDNPAIDGQFVLHPAVNTFALNESLSADLPLPSTRPYAVWSARNEPYKNGELAIQSIFGLKEPFDLVMFGNYSRKIEENENHKVIFLNHADDRTKFNAIANAEFVMAPSLFEGFGMVPGEALCCGTPVITFDLPVLKQVYKSKISVVKYGDNKLYRQRVRAYAGEISGSKKPPNAKNARDLYGMGAMEKSILDIPFLNISTKRIGVQMLSYWGFLPQSLESVYPYVDQIEVAFGRTPEATEIDDGSLDALMNFDDPDHKIKITNKTWQNKKEMRNYCASKLDCTHQLLLDGDEIWTGLDKWIEAGINWGCPRWVNLWHNGNFWVHDYKDARNGMRWGVALDSCGSLCPHYRWSYWRRSYNFKHHAAPEDMVGVTLHDRLGMAAKKTPESVIYHLGHALSLDVMKAKHQYYKDRDGDNRTTQNRADCWMNWNGNEGDCGDGIISPVTWELPEIVEDALKNLEG